MAYVPNDIHISYSNMSSTGYQGSIPSGRHRFVMNTVFPTSSAEGFVKQEAVQYHSTRSAANYAYAQRQKDDIKPRFSREGIRHSIAVWIIVVFVAVLGGIFMLQLRSVGMIENDNDRLQASVNSYTQEGFELEKRLEAEEAKLVQNLAQLALDMGMTNSTSTTSVTLSVNPEAVFYLNVYQE